MRFFNFSSDWFKIVFSWKNLTLGKSLSGLKIFYWSPAFRICTGCLQKYEWNLLKIGFKNTYFQVFQGFPALKETVAHIQPNGQFWTIFGQNGQNGIFFKKAIGTFSLWKALINCKVSEKSNERFSSNSVTDVRTYVRTDARTWILRSPTTSSRDQKPL